MAHAIVEKIREAGVVGAGGAGLPTHVKTDAKVDTVLVNGASCEPLLTSDPYLMDAEVDTMLRGLQAVVECTLVYEPDCVRECDFFDHVISCKCIMTYLGCSIFYGVFL